MSENPNATYVESMWGLKVLDEGFTNLPNLIIRNLSRVNMSPAEYVVVSIILTFKHDTKDPFPSQETIARLYFGDKYQPETSERAIRKHLRNLEKKKLVRIGYKYNSKGKRQCSVYNFEPLINAVLELHEIEEKEVQQDTIHWKDEVDEKPTTGTKSSTSTGTKSSSTTGTKSSTSRLPKVPTKKKREKENLKKQNEKENLSIQEEINNANLPATTRNVLLKNIDRLIDNNITVLDVFDNYELNKEFVNVAQYNSALKFAFNLKKFTDSFDDVMATNVKKQLEFANENAGTKGKRKPVRKEIVPESIKNPEKAASVPEIDNFEEEKRKLEEELKGLSAEIRNKYEQSQQTITAQ
ncbi:helix-turn-helix domain-containing protein [Priestia megaterium]|uniref:helix-turn-helix domain-containing protein n=1 Tax=Priestia megaterium TaxID=1404 RepID=UPI0031FD5A29